jgi:hypothetical protein
MENVVTFYEHLEYFTAIWCNLWPFVIVFGHLAYFFPSLVCSDPEKNLAALVSRRLQTAKSFFKHWKQKVIKTLKPFRC